MGISEMLQNYWFSPLVTDRIAFVCFVIANQEQDMLEKMVIISLVIDLGLYRCETFEGLLCTQCLQIQHTDFNGQRCSFKI